MAVSSPALREAFAEIVGSGDVLDAPDVLDAHRVDGLRPRWIARPGTVDEVSRLMALAHVERLAVLPRGSGSALALGNPPKRLDIVVDLRRLDAVTDYVPADMVASVEAGISLGTLARQLGEHGQMLALDPPGGSSRSIGGILATNASGPLRFRYGTARDLTLGVRFVQADGTVTWGGARVVKSVTGYDVPKLLVGSFGTLGIIVGATLRLHPKPPARGSWLLAWNAREAAQSFIAALIASSLEPDRVIALNEEAGRAYGCADKKLALLVSIGSVTEAVSSQGEAMSGLARAHGAEVRSVPGSCWEQLDAILAGDVSFRLNSEPRRTVHWLGEVERLASGLDLRVLAVAQPGSGVMHAVVSDQISGTVLDQGLFRPLRAGLAPEGGSLVVERAAADLKENFDVWGPISPDSQAIMSRLKAEFDPDGTLSPGRFVGGL